MSALSFSDMRLLNAENWKVSYRQEDGNLIALFYVPALARSVRYDRMSGYFSASALAIAARGIDQFVANHGRMRLIVGCTLEAPESEAIAEGYDLRAGMEAQLASTALEPPDSAALAALRRLASMVAKGNLDVKVAVPVDELGRPASGIGIYHEKVGILTDLDGNQLAFSGSINETAAGWLFNRESFQVFCSWFGGRELEHVQSEVKAFAQLWEDRCTSVRVFDFPEAAKAKLLKFLPPMDRQMDQTGELIILPPPLPLPALSVEEKRRIVWSYIRHAASLPNGLRVGEKTSAVSPWRHQLGTFAKFIQSWPSRLLIADEVGLGKTVTAGLILRQAWLSALARRVLILAPASLLIQWQRELYEKFNLNAPVYTGKQLIWHRLHADQEPKQIGVSPAEWHKQPFVLASSHLLRRKERHAEVLGAENWDLVVLDEAHHARRKGGGTSDGYHPNTLLKLMSGLKSKASSLLLLTATPMQVHPVEIWDLLQLLGLPEKWDASDGFLHYFEQVTQESLSQAELEVLAEMFRIAEQSYGPVSPDHVRKLLPSSVTAIVANRVLKALRDAKSGIQLRRLSAEERKLALLILQRVTPLRYRMARQTRNLLRQYYKEGKLDSPIATRDPRDIAIDLSPQERALYEAVEDYISKTYNKAALNARSAVGFVMTIYRRRLASSFYALERTLVNRLNHVAGLSEEDLSLGEEGDGEAMDAEEANELASSAAACEEVSEIKGLLKRISQLPIDSKAQRLLKELNLAFQDGYDSVIIFTQYRDTMDYLKDRLGDALPGKKMGCYLGEGGLRRDTGGAWTKCRKEDIKHDLKAKKIEILICTDAAGEGLNLQFCGALVNYDLPWNPMKVEQRIGRIDRIGQVFKVIRIYNLAYQDTVEADVYFKIGERINLFQGIVGKLQPILSRLPKKFEEYTLGKAADREESRARLMADIEDMEREANTSGFDIDVTGAEESDVLNLPESCLSLRDIDRVTAEKELLPAALAWRALDVCSYAARLPGMGAETRATTSSEVFSDCSDSQTLFSPGGELFENVADLAAPVADDRSRGGVCWLVQKNGKREFLVATRDGIRGIGSFEELLRACEEVSAPQELAEEVEIVERVA